MNKVSEVCAKLFLKFTGFSYTNLARLFVRLFVGIMFMQFGIRQMMNFNILAPTFPTILGMSPDVCLMLMIVIEILCSFLIMIGLLTRLATIPPLISMIWAEYYIVEVMLKGLDFSALGLEPGYVPVMFIGIYIYILLAGPGKISLDYLISLHILSATGKSEEEELEDV
ncbi:MAG: DoxX family protein [Muribaculaceae bacterium]|nr:DoxX family protein [Muribaculaceae bacterium]